MTYRPNFHQLHIFCVLAEARSFAKASERLFISQPAISAQMKQLQERLGVLLFRRVGRRSMVNEAGDLVYWYARRMVEMTQGLTRALEELQGDADGQLRPEVGRGALLPSPNGESASTVPPIDPHS